MGLLHLLHIFFGMLIVYFGLALVVSLLLVGAAILIGYKVTKTIRKFLATLAVVIFLSVTCTRTVYASQAITDKQFAKEVEGIVREDRLDIGEYQYRVHDNVTTQEETLYVTLVEADLTLVSTKLHLFKKHKATRSDVDQVLGQLLRDLENAPGTEDSRPTL